MSPDTNLSIPDRKRLPVGKILLGAPVLAWIQRWSLLRGLGPTVVILIAIKLFWSSMHTEFGPVGTMLFLAVSMALHAKFAVICHRLILVDFSSGSKLVMPTSWSDRETRFFGRMIVIYFLVSIGSIVLMMVPLSLFLQMLPEAARDNPAKVVPYSVLFIGPPATYLLARLSLILPATALDRTEKLSWAWKASAGNGLQLAVLVGLLPWASGLFNYLFIGTNPDIITIVVVNIVNYVLMTIEIIALSLAYRELFLKD